MLNETIKTNKAIQRGVRALLLAGIIFFGFIYPDSLSDHTKMVHFCAHVGMSFLLASVIYVVCYVMLHIRRFWSLTWLIVITLIIGAFYKYFEIAGEGLLHAYYSLGQLLTATGCYTSMSQNTAGILAAILLIEYLNLAFQERWSRRVPAV